MFPSPHGMLAERSEIKDGPQICRVGSARTDEIAEQVQVKDEKGQSKYMPAPPAKSGKDRRTKQSRRQTVQQPMVVLGIKIEIPPGERAVSDVDYNAQPIQIRDRKSTRLN